MGVYHFDNPKSEQDLYKELRQRKTQWTRAQSAVNKADAERATAIAQLYPNFSPDVITSLTMLQVKPEAEVLNTLSQRIVEHNKKNTIEKIFDPLKGAVRFGLLALEDLYRTTVDRPINSMIAATIGDNAENLSFADAYKQSGKSTVKQVFKNLAQGKEVNLGDGLLPQSEVFDPDNPNSKMYDEYKYLIQSGFDQQRAQSIIQNQLGSAITEIDRNMQEDSGLFNISTTLGTGETVQTPISLGRTVALGVSEPGTTAFNAISGVLDAGKALFLDPANYLTLGAAAAAKSRKILRPSDNLIKQLGFKDPEKMTKAQLAEIGMINRGWGLSFVTPKSVTDYLNKDPGGMKLVKYLSKIESESKFMDITGIKDPGVVKEFMKVSQDFTKTADEKIIDMANLLDRAIGFRDMPFGNVRPTVGAIGRFLGGTAEAIAGTNVPTGTGTLFGAKKVFKLALMDSNSRSARIMATYTKDLPLRYLDSENIEQSFDQIKKWLDQTDLNRNTKDSILKDTMNLKNRDQAGLFRVAVNMLEETGRDLVENGQVSSQDARTFTRIFEETIDDMRKYFIDGYTGDNVRQPGMKMNPITVEGKMKAMPDAHLTTEFINRTIPMPDAGQLAKAMNSMSILRSKMGGTKAFDNFLAKYPKKMQKGITGRTVDWYYTEFWKPAVLLRGAWLLRVVGEEQLRMFTRGYDNIFSRPLSILSLGLAKATGAGKEAAQAKRWTQKDVEFKDLLGDPLSESLEWKQGSSRMRGANNNDELFGGAARNQRKQQGRRKKAGPHDYDVLDRADAIRGMTTGDRASGNKFVRSWTNEVAKIYQDDLFQLLFKNKNNPKARQNALKEWVEGKSPKAKAVIEEYAKGGERYEDVMSVAGGRYAYAKSIEARLHQAAGGAFDEDVTILEDLMNKLEFEDIDFGKNPFPLRIDKPRNEDLYAMITTGKLKHIATEATEGVWTDAALLTPAQIKNAASSVEHAGKTMYLIKEGQGLDGIEDLDDLFKIFGKGFTTLDDKSMRKAANSYYDTILNNYIEDLPQYVTAPLDGTVLDDTKWIERFVNKMFDEIMGQRTDNASRSPVFRQAYWRAVYDLLPRMTPAMRTVLLEGKSYSKKGKNIKVSGARNSNIPNENLLASIKADIGLPSVKLRKADTEINLDMFERRVKELNQADLKAGREYVDNTNMIQKMQRDVSIYKRKQQKLIDDIDDQINIGGDDIDVDSLLAQKEALIDELNDGLTSFNTAIDDLNAVAGFDNNIVDAEYVDNFAKAIALEELQGLLYDLSKRSKITYNLRGIFPFGEAYVEILSTWAKLLKENPEIVRRGQVTVQAARDKNPFSPVEGEGFLSEDEVTGEEIFYYPLVDDLVSDAIFGQDRNVGVRLPGYAGSLNIALEVVPGIGPTAAIPAAFFLEGTPKFTETQKFLFPYGLPTVKTPGDLIQEAGVPAWLKNGVRAAFMFNEDAPPGELSRIAANTTIDVYRVLKANGEDDMTPEAQQRLLEKSRSIGRNLTLIKMFSQFVGPTGLNPRFDIGDPKNAGNVYSMQILADRYRELIETPPKDPVTGNLLFAPGDNYSATKYFIDEFGFNPLDIATPKSIVVEPRPVDERGVQFEKENPELFEEYKLTAFYAVPNGGGGPFDYEAYTRTIYNEQREPLTPEEWLATRNQRLGEFFMEEERVASLAQFDITDPYQAKQRSRLLALKRNIAATKYPGFDTSIPGLPQRGTLDAQYEELKNWENSPKLRNTETGKAVAQVLDYIEILEKKSLGKGLSSNGWRTSRTMLVERQQLRDFIGQIAVSNDDFYVIAQNLLLPLFQERTQFLEDLEYDYDTMVEYGAYLPTQQGEA